MNNLSLFDLTDKTAIITGGGNGIGRASSIMLATSGANIVVSDFNLEAAEDVAKDINDKGGSAIAVKCDVTNDEELVALVDITLKTFKGYNVNNVGVGWRQRKPFEIEVGSVSCVFERNLFSMWRLTVLLHI